MRIRVSCAIALLGLTTWCLPVARADKPAKPTVVVRLSALDSLVADARYLAELAGKGEEAKQAEGVLKSMTGDKGLEGLDTTRPMGLYGYLGPNGIDSQVVLLLPIADEKAFVAKLESLDIKPKKDGDLYEVSVERVPFPVYFRFNGKYLFATLREKEAIDKDKLLDPATLLAGPGIASLVVNLDEIPKELKEIAIGQSELQLANAKDKATPGETKAQKAFRMALIDEAAARFKQLLTEGGELAVRLDLDRKANEVGASIDLSGKAGSKLATEIADLRKVQSAVAGLVGPDTAMSLLIDASLPAKLGALLAPVVEQHMQNAMNEAAHTILEPVVKTLMPTAKMGQLDAAMVLRGPGAGGLYTVVVGTRVKDGMAIESAVKEALKSVPAEVANKITVDFAKSGDVHIHKVLPDKVDKDTLSLLGDNPIFFAFRDDALLLSAGAGGEEAIKAAVQAAATTGKVFQLETSFARIAKLMAKEQKEAPAVAKKVFKGAGDDRVRFALEGGKTLKVSLTARTTIVKFLAELEEAKKAR